MIICCASQNTGFHISELAPWAQIIIALVNIALAYNVFVYQRGHNERTRNQTALLHEQNIKLQWFKELIITPNIKAVYQFYDNLEQIKTKITSDNLTDDQIININSYIKQEASTLRKSFIDIILYIDKKLYEKIIGNVDDLVTKLTEAVSNDEYKLTNTKTFETHITTPIAYSKNNLLSFIYNFKAS